MQHSISPSVGEEGQGMKSHSVKSTYSYGDK